MIVRHRTNPPNPDTEYTMALTATEFHALKAMVAACSDQLAGSRFFGLSLYLFTQMSTPTEV